MPKVATPASCFDEEGVGVAVIAALEFDDEVASGVSAGEADGGHAGFGAGADEAKFFDGGEAVGDAFGEVGFGGDGGPEAGSSGGGLLDGFDDGGEGVAEDHGAPGAEEVEVAVAVDVVEVGSAGRGSMKGGVSAYGAEGSDGGVDASGKEGFGAELELAGAGLGAGHSCQYMRRGGRILRSVGDVRGIGPMRGVHRGEVR